MSIAENKAVVLRLMEEYFNNSDEKTWEALADPDVVIHGATGSVQGSEIAKSFYAQMKVTFRPWHFTVEDLIAEGDQVVVRLIESGTMSGPFMGQPPSGKQFSTEAVQICRLRDGKLVEMWGFRDTGSVMRQLALTSTSVPASIHQ